MSISAKGTTFKLRTPAHIKSCHLTGSWDKYQKRYNMTEDRTAGPGWWSITLQFGSTMPPGRYWYYFILDGYFESHDPNRSNCFEPTRKITLNILDYSAGGRDASPVSATTTSSRSSSRFPSPTSTTRTSPISATSSKRSGGVYDRASFDGYAHSRTSSKESTPYYHDKPQPSLPRNRTPSPRRRTPSPRRRQAELMHIVHPKPRNPLGNHKLTLDTSSVYRPISIITTAATNAGDSPVSASSSRSTSSLGSICSSCSGSSTDSPTTPMCTCSQFDDHRSGECPYPEEYSDECYTDSEEEEVEAYRHSRVERRKTYYQPSIVQEELAYRLQNGLRM